MAYLAVESQGVRDLHADHAASHVGKALGIVTCLRATLYNRARQRVVIPAELLRKHSVTEAHTLGGGSGGPGSPPVAPAPLELREAAYDLAATAHVHLEHARAMLPRAPAGTAPALLPAVDAALYLERLRQLDFDVFHPSLAPGASPGNLPLLWALAKGAWRGTF
jgi:NADH dehydrogenase [ubiquinone] 1 alpha subcomplex assembly factor 6